MIKNETCNATHLDIIRFLHRHPGGVFLYNGRESNTQSAAVDTITAALNHRLGAERNKLLVVCHVRHHAVHLFPGEPAHIKYMYMVSDV